MAASNTHGGDNTQTKATDSVESTYTTYTESETSSEASGDYGIVSKPSPFVLESHEDGDSTVWWMSYARHWRAGKRRSLPLKRTRDQTTEGRETVAPIDKFLNQYRIGKFVGQGAYSKVRRVQNCVEDGKEYALRHYLTHSCKRSRAARYGEDDVELITEYDKVLDEILLYSKLRHPNICQLHEVYSCESKGYLYMIMEYLPFQSMTWRHRFGLYSIPFAALKTNCGVDKTKFKGMVALYSEEGAKRIILQVARAVEYTHKCHVIHKDIKPDNVLLTGPLVADDVIYIDTNSSKEAAAESSDASFSTDDESDEDADMYLWESSPLLEDAQIKTEATRLMKRAEKSRRSTIAAIRSYYKLGNPSKHSASTLKTELDSSVSKCMAPDATNLESAHPLLESYTVKPTAKLIDFNSAVFAKPPYFPIWDCDGTKHFTPPECLSMNGDGAAVNGQSRDIWSIGCLLYCLLFGHLPFAGKTSIALHLAIFNGEVVIPNNRPVSKEAKLLIRHLLEKDPKDRITLSGLLCHPWFNK